MKPRHAVMALALAVAAGLAVFGDKTPEDALAEPVERARGPAPRVPAPATVEKNAEGNKEAAILRLLPRETLIGGDDRFGQDGGQDAVFARQDWTPPPPPPPPAQEPPPPPSLVEPRARPAPPRSGSGSPGCSTAQCLSKTGRFPSRYGSAYPQA